MLMIYPLIQKNIDTGAVIANNSVLRGSVNAQKIKKKMTIMFLYLS